MDELPTSLDLVEFDKDQTLGGRVWVRFNSNSRFGTIRTLVRRCGVPGGVEFIVVMTLRN